MINAYYQQELSHLRDLAVEFSRIHPALAPMLSGPTQDPDVERLLEGTAFLTGLLRQKLDDEFPEVVHGLMQLVFPHYLRPLPATTIIQFTPKPSLMETLMIPSGAALDSVPVDGTKCTFRTCYNVEVHPLSVKDARLTEKPGYPTTLSISFALNGMSLTDWKADSIRLHLTGPYAQAANIYSLLLRNTRHFTVSSSQGGGSVFPGRNIVPAGFSNQESLIPYPTHSFPGYRILQEYFIRPEKFLFLDITGLSGWKERGGGGDFTIVFELKDPPALLPQVKKDNFLLFATPAINLFPHDGDPISLDHRQPEYRLVPSGGKPDHYQVYSVRSITGFAPGTVQKREYVPFELFAPQSAESPVYYENRKMSPIRSRAEVYISVAYPPNSGTPAPETLSIELYCTNFSLPENLKYGDICEQTSSSPELCEFKNILVPSAVVQPPLGKNVLWRFLSHLSLNLLSLANKENLKAMLKLYIFSESKDKAVVLANEKRIEGILDVLVDSRNRLVRGVNMRGQHINIKMNPDYFASRGDMYLFGSIMDHFLGTYASVNCFTHFFSGRIAYGGRLFMAGKNGRSPLNLKEDLLNNPRRYSFFQAIRLLRLFVKMEGEGSDEALFQDLLRVRPLLSLSFPGTDVWDIEESHYRESIRYNLTATFLGLYGASSPLPTHYTEDLLDEASDDKSVTRDFLDILSHPFYLLFFQDWTKYRWFLKVTEEGSDRYLERLYCLLGLGAPELRDATYESRRLLRYIGLFTQFPRSAKGLETLLADALEVPEMEVIQGVLRLVRIPEEQCCLLGLQGSTLGEECYLGEEIEDRMGKIRIKAGPMDEARFRNMLPDSRGHVDVIELTRAYLNQPMERELELVMNKEQARPLTLGAKQWGALGWDTWMYSTPGLETEASVTFQLPLKQ